MKLHLSLNIYILNCLLELNEYFANEQFQVFAHELGHNFGMYHDFADRHGGAGNPCDNTGIMSYGTYDFWETTSEWSTCSAADFLEHYEAYSWINYCLDDISGITRWPNIIQIRDRVILQFQSI